MKLEEMPEYQAARNEYVAAVAVADRTNDETAKLRAELAWTTRQSELKDTLRETESKAEALRAAHEKIKTDYPFVPESLLQNLTDPETLLAVAKDMAEKIGQSGDWGDPGAGAGQRAPRGRKTYLDIDQKDHNELIDKVNTGDLAANKRFRTLLMEKKMLPFIERMNSSFGKQ